MSFSSRFRNYFKNWLGNKKKRPITKRSKAPKLLVEMLEERMVMSTLPPAVVGPQTFNLGNLTPNPGERPQSLNPTVAIDPLDPNKIVEVHATYFVPRNGATPHYILEGSYSLDAGRNWNYFSVG